MNRQARIVRNLSVAYAKQEAARMNQHRFRNMHQTRRMAASKIQQAAHRRRISNLSRKVAARNAHLSILASTRNEAYAELGKAHTNYIAQEGRYLAELDRISEERHNTDRWNGVLFIIILFLVIFLIVSYVFFL